MPYTPDQIEQIEEMLEEWRAREAALSRSLFAYPFRAPRAREMMQHGLSRRLADLKHGLERVFEILPPESRSPTQRELRDATAFLQAFVINTFGAIDNLAWVWTCEADIRDNRGRQPKPGRIGFTPDHDLLRQSVSQRTRDHLQGTDDWFGYLEGYRHALAHRIPLYIPPKIVDEAEAAEFHRLEGQVGAEGWEWNRWGEVLAAQ